MTDALFALKEVTLDTLNARTAAQASHNHENPDQIELDHPGAGGVRRIVGYLRQHRPAAGGFPSTARSATVGRRAG